MVDEWYSGWVKSDKCKVYLLYCIDISGECPFVFVKIGAFQKWPASVSKYSCTHSCWLSPPLLLFLTNLTTWNKFNKNALKKIERGNVGHYFFRLTNNTTNYEKLVYILAGLVKSIHT
jgi:hypothetical protein